VRDVFTDHGFGECERSRPFERFVAAESRDRVAHLVEGLQTLGLPGFDALGVPAYKQFCVEVPDGTEAVRLTWVVQGGLGGLFGGGGDDPALDVGVRAGQPVRLTYEDAPAAALDARFSPAVAEGVQTVVLAGDCLPAAGERLHTLFFNMGNDQVQITEMGVDLLDAVPIDETVEACQAE